MTRPEAHVRPLSAENAARIDSSIVLNDLHDVVQGLLENALDAHATLVDLTISHSRSFCEVEDNGTGIPTSEFEESGGLGKRNWTSKKYNEASHGTRGAFLASVAALASLTISSRHKDATVLNSLVLRHSKPVTRLMPATSLQDLTLHAHGTRVTVGDLFGNIPVRAKRQAATTQRPAELERLSKTLTKRIVALLIAWSKPVKVTLRLNDTNKKVIFDTTRFVTEGQVSLDAGACSTSNPGLPYHLLCQLDRSVQGTSTKWIPVSASSQSYLVEGAICLEPAPDKNLQFISIGIHPLLSGLTSQGLFDIVNKLFGNSSFGNPVELEQSAKSASSGRFKSNTNLPGSRNATKGIDRYPRFYLNIKNSDPTSMKALYKACQRGDEKLLTEVTDILRTVINQWLTTHHFCKRTATVNGQDDTLARGTPLSTQRSSRVSRQFTPKPNGIDTSNVFANWKRIKSARPEFLDQAWLGDSSFLKENNAPVTRRLAETQPEIERPNSTSQLSAAPISQSTPSQDSSQNALPVRPSTTSDFGSVSGHPPPFRSTDGQTSILWREGPTSHRVLSVHPVTGQAITHVPKESPSFSSPRGLSEDTPLGTTRSTRLDGESGDSPRGPWLAKFLDSWTSPVFRKPQTPIPRTIEAESPNPNNQQAAIEGELISGITSVLSRESLKHASVIAQVDKKFILIKILASEDNSTSGVSPLLILVDQHAADERCILETLWSEFVQPPDETSRSFRSSLGCRSSVACLKLQRPLIFEISEQEADMLREQAADFAHWGILYDVYLPSGEAPRNSIDIAKWRIEVTTLPSSIAERCRLEPKLLIQLLRREIWGAEERPTSSRSVRHDRPAYQKASNQSQDASTWFERIHQCPQGIVEMLNSRSCRSAIMFNDVLNIEECTELISKLSACMFPFQCAHGRPTMVPLIRLQEGDIVDASRPNTASDVAFQVSARHIERPETPTTNAYKDWLGGTS